MGPEGAGAPAAHRDARGTAALSGRKQDTATGALSVHSTVDDALVLIERGVAIAATPMARHAQVRVTDFGYHIASVVAGLPLESFSVAIVVRDTPRRDIRAAVRELLARGVDPHELHVHRVEPSRSAGGAR